MCRRPRLVCQLPGLLRRLAHEVWAVCMQCMLKLHRSARPKTNWTRARGLVDRSTPDFLLLQVQRQHFITPLRQFSTRSCELREDGHTLLRLERELQSKIPLAVNTVSQDSS